MIVNTDSFQRALAALPLATYQAGETVLAAGSKTGRLLILREGAVAIVKETIEIAKVTEPGAVFGELSALLDQPHTADVRALEKSQFYVADAARLVQDSIATLYIAAVLARRLDGANTALIELKRQLQAGQPRSVIAKTVDKVATALFEGVTHLLKPVPRKGPDLDRGFHPWSGVIIAGIISAAVLFVAYSLYSDVDATGTRVALPYVLIFVALLTALGFAFVNGFHDTANAVATVIYTRSLPANIAVVWSGTCNLIGVLLSSGAIAFGIVSLEPIELILQAGSSADFAMVFALLIGAIAWNLGTWYLGLPASSSHTLIGSIIGVSIANALLRGQAGISGVDWSKATEIGYALLLSPLFGFAVSALLLFALKFVVRDAALYVEPKGDQPPPWWIRGILILTCTLVSFFHGSNDGQKGINLIMMTLIGAPCR